MQEQAIRVSDYPQLALLAWHRHGEFIDPEIALELYETNWRFIDEETLTDRERKLIQYLVETYGKGVLNVYGPHPRFKIR